MIATNSVSEDYVASCLLNKPSEALNLINADGGEILFHNYLPRMIYNMSKSLSLEGREHEVEMLEFSDEIRQKPDGREVGSAMSKVRVLFQGMEYLSQHLKNLKKAAATRKASEVLSEATEAVSSGHTPDQLSEAFREGSRAIMSIMSSFDDIKDSKQSLMEFVEMMEMIHLTKQKRGFDTGITELTDETGGFGSNQLWVVGAQTSRGKTVLMFQFMLAMLNQGKHCLLISLETEAANVHARLAANDLTIPLDKILGNNSEVMAKPQMMQIKEYFNKHKEADNLHISDADNINLETIIAQCEKLKEKGYPLDMIVVDYIQLVTVAESNNRSRQEQVAEVTRTLKQLAKKYKCTVLTASQLNDDGKVRESRAIAQDADVLIKIDDDALVLSKNRNGRRGVKLDLTLNGRYQRFEKVNILDERQGKRYF